MDSLLVMGARQDLLWGTEHVIEDSRNPTAAVLSAPDKQHLQLTCKEDITCTVECKLLRGAIALCGKNALSQSDLLQESKAAAAGPRLRI